jgi:hypothetical protein
MNKLLVYNVVKNENNIFVVLMSVIEIISLALFIYLVMQID